MLNVKKSISRVWEWKEMDSLGRDLVCILYSDGTVVKRLV